jgi:hypothetical protein
MLKCRDRVDYSQILFEKTSGLYQRILTTMDRPSVSVLDNQNVLDMQNSPSTDLRASGSSGPPEVTSSVCGVKAGAPRPISIVSRLPATVTNNECQITN